MLAVRGPGLLSIGGASHRRRLREEIVLLKRLTLDYAESLQVEAMQAERPADQERHADLKR